MLGGVTLLEKVLMKGNILQLFKNSLKIGMLLFIIAWKNVFRAFFHFRFNPSVFLVGGLATHFLIILNPRKIPLLNTNILFTSVETITLVPSLYCLWI